MHRPIVFLLFAWASTHATANPYAPLADVANVENLSLNVMATELDEAKIPDANTVGVPAYPGARIVYINQLSQVRAGKIQETNVVILYTADSIDKVAAYYQSGNPDWVWQELDECQPYPIYGAALENLPGSSTHAMSGPVVALADIGHEACTPAADVGLFLEMAPDSRTGIKIEYAGKTHDIINVDEKVIDRALQQCIPHEALQEAQAAWDRTHPAMREVTQAHYEAAICDRTAKSCENRPNATECQGFLRRYAG